MAVETLPVSLPIPQGALPIGAFAGWPAGRGGSLFDQLMALRRRWRMILLTALAVPLLCGLALLKMPSRYTATGIVLYDPAASAPPDSNTVDTDIDALDQDAITASQAAIITSLPAASALATQLNLAARPEFNPGLRHRMWLPRWFSGTTLKAGNGSADRIALGVQHVLNVSEVSGSRVLEVSFTSTDPALAEAGANAAIQIYIDHERQESFANMSDAQNWLGSNALTLQTEIDKTDLALANARAVAGIVPGAQADLTTETASRITASLVDAQAGLAMAQARLASAANGDAAAANAAIAPSLEPLRKEQADLTAQVQSLADDYGPDYPDLISARTSLAAISSEIGAETGRELQAAEAEVAADRAQVATLSNALSAARALSQAEDVESTPIRALEQRGDALKAMLRSVTLQSDQLAQQAALTKPDARMLSEATLPETPSSPRRKLVLLAAAALGACLGVLLSGLADALDTSFRDGGDLRSDLGLNCLALVPEIGAPREAPVNAPFSVFSEQMRALRTGLALRNPGGPRGPASQVMAITAARPGEGKTTLTVALARALAMSGLKVLAIDGDIRQPSFDMIFTIHGATGLTDHLAGLASLKSITRQDALSPLRIIPAGTQSRDALSLFLSPRLPAMLDLLRKSYDVILLDVPPAFALAEARVLARLADSALLCVRWGKTPRRVVRAAVTLLQEAGVNLSGAALTRVNATVHGRSGFADAEVYQPRYGGYFRN